MSIQHPPSNERSVHGPRDETLTAASFVGFPLLVVGLLVAISYPLLVATLVVGTAIVAKVLQTVLSSVVDRTSGSIREVAIPGIATIRFRISHN